MTQFDWKSLLTELSLKLIEYDKEMSGWVRSDGSTIEPKFTPELRESGWLGYARATEEQIIKAETRLGIQFPPSYREFLEVSNGWMDGGWADLQLWSTEDVDWFSARNQDWIDSWVYEGQAIPSVPDNQYFVYGKEQDVVNLRTEYLQNALEISSDSGDGDIYLLIPEVVFDDGEWEAWHFGSKLPGAARYRSFYELMQGIVDCGNFP
jgi:SMI1 / KNR4 family (SUKH-1)